MTPTLKFNLDIEPYTLMVKHLHRRVMAIALHERKRIPFCGRLVGQAKSGKGSVWLVEDDRGQLIKSQKPVVVEGA